MDERTGGREGRGDQTDRVDRVDRVERGGPPDPTRKLLKVFGVKVTDYEAKTDVLLARWATASSTDQDAIAREAAELSADLTHWLRELQTHVFERQERVLAAIGRR